MTRPMIATKLYVPALRHGLVRRPRLSERLRHGAESRLTLVSAPAGFGKTTLLAEWLGGKAGDNRCVAWLSLDPADNDPASFWTYVVTALRTAVPGVGSSALELITSTPPPTELVVTTVLNELAATSSSVWLVLDDYHLIDSRDLRAGVTFLLEHLPAHVHVVISTRADPDLPLSRWRVRGELLEIRAADLRFTSDEAAAYLNEVAELDLAAEQVAVLEERTEGWVAALQLAALSIRGRDDVSGFIARFAGNDRYIVDYLVDEVLQTQPDDVREFLLRSAVLDRFSGSLCDTVAERRDGGRLLITLERANLFIVPLDDRREWYRYHHLFADVLRARLLAERPELVPLLHQRASVWYEGHELVADAIRHSLAARDFDRAARLMEMALSEMRRTRQDAVLLAWPRSLPDVVVRRSPVLSIVAGWSMMVAGDLDATESRLDDAEAALAAGARDPELAAAWADTEDLRTAPATISVYRASLAQARGDVAGTVHHARRAMDAAGPEDHFLRGAAGGFLGLAAWAAGDITEGLATFSEAVRSLHAAGNLIDELDSTIVLADMQVASGRPSRARHLYERALRTATAGGEPYPRATADIHVGLAELDYEISDLASAGVHLETARVLAERACITENRYRWYVVEARVRAASEDVTTAIQLLDRAEALFRHGFYPDVRPIPAIRARVQIADGDLAAADEWAREHAVATTDQASYLREFDQLTLVRLLLARHRRRSENDPEGAGKTDLTLPDTALALLDRLQVEAEPGRPGSLIEISMLRALALHALRQRARALANLEYGMTRAPEPGSYVRLFLDEGDPMFDLLHDARQSDAGEHDTLRKHARRLLDAAAKETAPTRDQHGLPDRLSDRELDVLRLLDSDLTGPQIARELYVSLNTLRTHTKRIFTKLDVNTRVAAVRRAHERGLL